MTEQHSDDKYIKCGRCKMKYLNNDDHIKNYFGYTRLNERYKTCLVCRMTRLEYHKTYREEHKEQRKQHYQDNKEHRLAQSKAWQDKNKEYLAEQIECDKCGCYISRDNMTRHKKRQICIKNRNT